MTLIIGAALTLVAVAGTAVVGTSRPDRLAVVVSAYGLLLALLFMALQAPDVGLSQIGVGTAIVPLMVMLTVRKVRQPR
jgi:uncharacterized MnhB-related membrane protein